MAQSGQGTASPKQQYEEGKRYYQQGDYKNAIEAFRPLSRVTQGNPFAEYASFYFGLSALKDGQYDLAKNMFLQIQSKFPNWNKTDETFYWLADTYFQLENFNDALETVKQVSQGKYANRLQEDVLQLKEYELAKLRDTEKLNELLQAFPQDKAIAEQLVRVLSFGVYDEATQVRIDELISRYDINENEIGVLSKESSVKKNAYNVAVMLPFLYDNLSTSSRKQGNQFIIDLYKGIKMAAEDLEAKGLNVRIHAYDTERSSEVTEKLLKGNEMAMMDLFIGPLYPGPYQAVSDYAQKNQKYLFNPLSNNPAAIGENPFAYLMRPSLVTQGRMAAEFAIDSLNRSQAVVITGSRGQDSLLVSSFVSRFEEDGNREATVLKEDNFNRERMDELVEMLDELGEDNLIYLASGNELIISNTISAVVMAEEKIPVIGGEDWLDAGSITYEQLENIEEYLIAPGFIDPTNEQLADFNDKYRRRFYDVPNKYVYTGYDLMMYIGSMLDRYGMYFQEFHAEEKHIPGSLYAGYDYFQANDNQLVPIVKYEGASLKQVNIQP
ncbi:MAG: hypothetical protein ACLFOZ_10940 [Cyclobacteriaceae bacterium]